MREDRGHTFENQFVFQNPGVPQGHAGRPPWSKHARTVKSLANQKFIALEIALRRDELFTKVSAPSIPPCQAAAIVTVYHAEGQDVNIKVIRRDAPIRLQ